MRMSWRKYERLLAKHGFKEVLPPKGKHRQFKHKNGRSITIPFSPRNEYAGDAYVSQLFGVGTRIRKGRDNADSNR